MSTRLLTATLLGALLVMAPTPATAAADSVVTFDDVAAGTVVGQQYAALGVAFGPGPVGTTGGKPVVAAVGAGVAQSGAQVGRLQVACPNGECGGPTPETDVALSGGHARVSAAVGAFGTASTTVTMTAFDAGGAQVGTPSSAHVTGGAGFHSRLIVSSSTEVIRFVRIKGSTIQTIGIDDLTVDTPAPAAPTFSIAPLRTPVTVSEGGTTLLPVVVNRTNFSGTVRIGVDPATLPAGVSVGSVDSTAAFTQMVNLPVSAASTAALTSNRQVTIVATPSLKGSLLPRSTKVGLTVFATYDPRVTGIEVSQGIQTLTLPGRNALAFNLAVPYNGVELAEDAPTVVRVYADINGASPPGGVSVGGLLYGFNAATGAPLPGGPLHPDDGPLVLTPGAAAPSIADRTTPRAAYTYTLPPTWVGVGRPAARQKQPDFRINLRAELLPQPSSDTLIECQSVATGSCVDNNRFALSNVLFNATCCVNVSPVLVHADGFTDPRPIDQVLAPALRLTPVELNLPAYRTTVDITDLVRTMAANAKAGVVDCYGTIPTLSQAYRCMKDVPARIVSEASAAGLSSDLLLALWSSQFPIGQGAPGFSYTSDGAQRPLTGIGHEFTHGLGRALHASASCGGGGEPWPPDEIGLIQGVGLDPGSGPTYRLFASPAGVPATPMTADFNAVVDLMSYCIFAPPWENTNVWVSVKGWNELIDRWKVNGGTARTAGDRTASAAATKPPKLLVFGSVAGGTVAIDSIHTGAGILPTGFGPSGYELIAQDRTGRAIARVPMQAARPHFDGQRIVSTPILEGAVPASIARRASRVEIALNGDVLASRNRSAHGPTARFISPRRGQLVGQGTRLAIRWRAADADHDPLAVAVEWSPDRGRPGTWRPVSVGMNGGLVKLPSNYFAGSADAFLRLRVNDGFNETVVLSPPFRTVHRGPRVRIVAPHAGTSVRQDATLVLRALAVDERGHPLPARAVTWLDGTRPLGHGEGLGVTGLTPGRHRLRLVAVDNAGRRAATATTITIAPVAPMFMTLRSPRRIRAGATEVILRVGSTIRATLAVRVGKHRIRAAIGSSTARVRVPVRPGRTPLILRLALTSHGRTTAATLRLTRG